MVPGTVAQTVVGSPLLLVQNLAESLSKGLHGERLLEKAQNVRVGGLSTGPEFSPESGCDFKERGASGAFLRSCERTLCRRGKGVSIRLRRVAGAVRAMRRRMVRRWAVWADAQHRAGTRRCGREKPGGWAAVVCRVGAILKSGDAILGPYRLAVPNFPDRSPASVVVVRRSRES